MFTEIPVKPLALAMGSFNSLWSCWWSRWLRLRQEPGDLPLCWSAGFGDPKCYRSLRSSGPRTNRIRSEVSARHGLGCDWLTASIQ